MLDKTVSLSVVFFLFSIAVSIPLPSLSFPKIYEKKEDGPQIKYEKITRRGVP